MAVSTPKKALLCTVAVWAAVLCGHVHGGEAADAYHAMVTSDNDELGRVTKTDGFFTWGATPCTDHGKYFAPPRNEASRVAYGAGSPTYGSVRLGWMGIKYNGTGELPGDVPNYFIVEGRFKGCHYAGFPFGDMSHYWSGNQILAPSDDSKNVIWRSYAIAIEYESLYDTTHCVAYNCNNNDDCFGNGVASTGTWPSCTCGSCATGTSGDNCNTFVVGSLSYTIHPSLMYGTADSMRAVCEASNQSMFIATSDKAEWDLLQTYIPSTYRFFVDMYDADNTSSWNSSNGNVVSTNATFASPYYGEWSADEGTNTTNGLQCVDMVGGKLYQSECTGNRYFMCSSIATTTPPTPSTTASTTANTTSSTTTPNTTLAAPQEGGAAGLASVVGVVVAMVAAVILL